MKDDKTEDMLLNNTTLDELIKMKIEDEFKSRPVKQKSAPKIVTEIQQVPKKLIFSKKSTFRVYNRTNKSETFINGIQADAMLGMQNSIREKILNGTLSVFSTDETYVKFEKAEIQDV